MNKQKPINLINGGNSTTHLPHLGPHSFENPLDRGTQPLLGR